jgi:predicted ATPase
MKQRGSSLTIEVSSTGVGVMKASTTRAISLRTLGGLSLEGVTFTRPKPLLLLTYLSLEGSQSRRHLAELFWPDAGDHMNSLTVALTQLRRAAPDLIEANDTHLQTSVECDAKQFLAALEGQDDARALELYKGAFLDGFFLRDWGEELEEWVYAKRERLALEVRKLLLKRAEAEMARGHTIEAGQWAERAYEVAGAPSLEPDELARLHDLLLVAESSLVTQLQKEAEEFGVKLLTLEAARAKFAATKLIANNLPALSTFFVGRESEVNVVCNLLEKDYRLITLLGPGGVGKTRLALEVAHQALKRKGFEDGVFFVPLAAISNPALVLPSIAQTLGIAEEATKTALASLTSALKDKHLLLVLDNLEQVISAATAIAELLSNCPHLSIVVTSRMPLHLSLEREFPVLPLALPGNQLDTEGVKYFPSVELFVERAKAVQPTFELTSENALAVAKICTRLDGLPLAIELAAARVKLFSPQRLLERLEHSLELLGHPRRDSPARHQTLRQAIAWSYDLLNEEEQKLFRQLAIFTGGFTLAAAEAIVPPLRFSVVDGIAELLDQSLLYRTSVDGRFSILETLREFGLEQLGASGERESAAKAHAAFFLKFAEDAEKHLLGRRHKEYSDALELDHDNLRAALTHADTQHDIETGLRLGAALWRFWNVRGHMREGREWLEKFIHVPDSVVHPQAKARALNALGTLVFETTSFREARPYFESSLALWRSLKDDKNALTVLNNLTWILFVMGKVQEGRSLIPEAVALAQRLEQPRAEALAFNNLGWFEQYQGNFVASRRALGKSLELRKKAYDERGVAFAQGNLALTLVYLGDYEAARALLDEAFETLQRLNDQQLLSYVYDIRATLEFFLGNRDLAETFLQEALGSWREVGSDVGIALTLNLYAELILHEGDKAKAMLEEAFAINQRMESHWHFVKGLYLKGRLALTQGNYAEARQHLQASFGHYETLESCYGKVLCLEALAELHLAEENYGESLEVFATARKLREDISFPVPPIYQVSHLKMVERLRAKLGMHFEKYWQTG